MAISSDTAQVMQQSKAVLDRVVGSQMSEQAKRIALALAWGESRYGVRGSFAPEGNPSNNWGAVVAQKGQDFFIHLDHRPDGTPVQVKFAKFNTPDAGAINFLKTWAKPDTLAAANLGDVYGVSAAMKSHGYYGGLPRKGATAAQIKAELGTPADNERRIQEYAAMINGLLKQVNEALGSAPMVSKTSSGTGIIVGGAIGLGLLYLILKR